MESYTEEVMDHFRNPRNVGEIEDPSGRGKVGNPVCGDIMELYIKVMHGPSGLTRTEREMVATIVSRTNRCHY